MLLFKHIYPQFIHRLNTPILSFLIGCIAFLAVAGLAPLNPTNIEWIHVLDPTQQYLGWEFFRKTSWAIPPGLNPSFGMFYSNSIVYTDSIPLFAFLFKAISPLLAKNFQYLGIWYLTSLVLQAYFALKIIGLISQSSLVQILGAILFTFSPILLFRINLQSALTAHFLILAALYLNLCPKIHKRIIAWAPLVLCAVMVNIYLFVMVLLLWIANVLDALSYKKSISAGQALIEAAIIFIAVITFGWLAGYFAVSETAIQGEYGAYAFNPLSILDPNGWSLFINSSVKDDYSLTGGFSYLGAGCLIGGILITLYTAHLRKLGGHVSAGIKNHFYLLLAFCGLLIFALSHQIQIGSWALSVPLPDSIISIASRLRHSNRFIWPIYYFLYFGIILLIVKNFNTKYAIAILASITFFQILDTSNGWLSTRSALNKRFLPADTVLKDPFWQCAGNHYKAVVLAQPDPSIIQPSWEIFSTYANRHRMTTNFTYFARVDRNKIIQFKNALTSSLEAGNYQNDWLYILLPWKENPTQKIIPNRPGDVFIEVDGFTVFAPDWHALKAQCRLQTQLPESNQYAPSINESKVIDFSNKSSGSQKFLLNGWSPPESWGTWSNDASADLVLPIFANTPNTLELAVIPYVNDQHLYQQISIDINNEKVFNGVLKKAGINHINFEVPNDAYETQFVRLKINFPTRMSPRRLEQIADDRELAIGLVSATFKK
jgi:hypothetical protein